MPGLEGVHWKPQRRYMRDFREFIDETGKLIILQSSSIPMSTHGARQLADAQHLVPRILFSTEVRDHEIHLE